MGTKVPFVGNTILQNEYEYKIKICEYIASTPRVRALNLRKEKKMITSANKHDSKTSTLILNKNLE